MITVAGSVGISSPSIRLDWEQFLLLLKRDLFGQHGEHRAWAEAPIGLRGEL